MRKCIKETTKKSRVEAFLKACYNGVHEWDYHLLHFQTQIKRYFHEVKKFSEKFSE